MKKQTKSQREKQKQELIMQMVDLTQILYDTQQELYRLHLKLKEITKKE